MSIPDDITSKVCRCCGEERPIDKFTADKKSSDGLHSYCKPCNAAKAVAYRATNKDKWASQEAAYRAANREKIAAKSAAYRRANVKKCIARTAAWRKANHEHVLAYSRAWREANPEQVTAQTRNRRARLNNAPGTHTAADVQVQFDAQKGRCFWCKSKLGDYHIDHVVPLTKGGSNWPSNLVVSCPTCNISKHDKHPMDYAGRLL